jgi:hypothetical protein
MYETPRIEAIGTASSLIQAYQGPQYDGGPYIYSFGFISSQLEEE